MSTQEMTYMGLAIISYCSIVILVTLLWQHLADEHRRKKEARAADKYKRYLRRRAAESFDAYLKECARMEAADETL